MQNSMTYIEQQLFFSIIHDNDFDPQNISEELPERVKYALSFYRNRRDDIAKENGELYYLKKEFDKLPKESKEYIKNSFPGIIRGKRKYMHQPWIISVVENDVNRRNTNIIDCV